MSSIPTPIIVFKIDASAVSQLSTATQAAFNAVKQQSKQTNDQLVADWRRLAAQARATLGQNVSGVNDVAEAHKKVVSIIDTQLNQLRQKDTLTKRELADLKAMTLERERQTDAIKRGQSVGTTLGTQSALGQVSFQTTQGIERVVDSVVNRYLGGAAGAVARTLRDVSYYSGQAGGSGGTGGLFSNLTAGASTLLSSLSPATLAIGSLTAGLVGTGVILGTVTRQMQDYAQSVQNLSATTGLSLSQVQQFNELAKLTGVSGESLNTALARVQVQLGDYASKGEKAGNESQAFVRVMNQLGISVTGVGGQLRPVSQVMGEFSDALAAIPDRETRTALGLEAMGTRGRVLVDMFEQARASGQKFSDLLAQTQKFALPDTEIRQLAKEKESWDKLTLSIDAAKTHLEGFIATHTGLTAFGLISPTGVPALVARAGALAGLSYVTEPGAPSTVGVPTAANAQAIVAKSIKEANDLLVNRAEIIKAGGKAQFDLTQAEKNYNDAIKNGQGAEALKYAQEIQSLQAALALDKQRLDIAKERQKLFDEFSKNYGGRPNERAQSHDRILDNLINPLRAPSVSADFAGNPVGGFFGSVGVAVPTGPGQSTVAAAKTNAVDLLNQITDEFNAKYKSQEQIDREHFDELRGTLSSYLKDGLISWSEYYVALQQIQQTQNATMLEFQKRFNQEAGSLFDDLASGNAKGFAKSLQRDLEDIVLKPVKDAFSKQLGSLFNGLNASINNPGSTTSTATGGGTSGGFWQRLVGGFNLGGNTSIATPPFFGGNIPGLSGGIGQKQFSTQTMLVTAGSVNIGGGTSGTGASGGSGGLSLGIPGVGSINLGGASTSTAGISSSVAQFGNFLANNNPTSLPLNLNQYGGVPGLSPGGATFGSTGGGPLFSALSPFLGAGGLIGASLAGHSITGAISGVGSLATAGTNALSLAGVIPSALGKSLGGAFAGGSLLAGGIETGGVSGGLQDLAGGTELGASLGSIVPGLGTAVGAAVGAIAGGITGIFRGLFGESYKDKVATYQQYHAYVSPPSETFQFASNGSIASTLSTGFAQSGNTFSKFGLPSGTPFSASAFVGELTPAELALLLQQGSISSANAFGNTFNPVQGGRTSTTARAFGNPSLTAPQVNVHFHLPGYVDANTTMQALGPAMDQITQTVVSKFRQSSSGLGSTVRALTTLP